jgi:hypothetical protein
LVTPDLSEVRFSGQSLTLILGPTKARKPYTMKTFS